MSKLTSGPTNAMENSMPGVCGSCSILDTPPKMNSVIFLTGKPRARATKECASSCSSTETNRSSAEMKPRRKYVVAEYPGYNPGNHPVASENVRKTRIINQLT